MGNNEYYEQVLRVITYLEKVNLKAYKLKDEKWYEIGDVQDLDIAKTLFAEDDAELALYQRRFGGYWRFPKLKDFCYFTASELTAILLNKYKIFIKDCTGKRGFEDKNYVRIAVRNGEDNDYLLDKLKELQEVMKER